VRRFPFTLALLPGGELAGTVDVRGRAAGGFVVRFDGSGARGRVTETTIATTEQIRAWTGTDLQALEVT
jgi:hypothetical protein